MRFGRLWLIALVTLSLQIYFFGARDGQDESRRPIPEQPRAPRPGPGSTPFMPGGVPTGPAFTVDVGEKGSGLGTAFSIRDDGFWITAKHVVDGCDAVGLRVDGGGQPYRVRVIAVHPAADIAVLHSVQGRPAFSLSREGFQPGQPGFHFGFPSGKPGQVSSSYLGRRELRSIGRYRQREPVVVWVERRRVPSFDELGGISGGPALDANGNIVGVTVAGSPRRGRILTTAPASMTAVLLQAGVNVRGKSWAGLKIARGSEEGFVDVGDALRGRYSVAQVFCRVQERRRRPRF